MSDYSPKIYISQYGKDTAIRCECCYGEMVYPVEESAVVWYQRMECDFVYYTGFHVTHRSSSCIDSLFRGVTRALWIPTSDLFTDGVFNLDYFLKERYDDSGNRIDADLKIDRASLDRVAEALIQITPPRPAKKPKARLNGTEGYVYLLRSPTGAYKIGRTVNPKDRLKTFSVKLPFEVEFEAVIQTPDMYKLENDLHKRFAEKRLKGEFFKLSLEDVAFIKGLAS